MMTFFTFALYAITITVLTLLAIGFCRLVRFRYSHAGKMAWNMAKRDVDRLEENGYLRIEIGRCSIGKYTDRELKLIQIEKFLN